MPERKLTPEEAEDVHRDAMRFRLFNRGVSFGDVPPAIVAQPILRILFLLRPLWENDAQFDADWKHVMRGDYADAVANPRVWDIMYHADNLDALNLIEDLLQRYSPAERNMSLGGGVLE